VLVVAFASAAFPIIFVIIVNHTLSISSTLSFFLSFFLSLSLSLRLPLSFRFVKVAATKRFGAKVMLAGKSFEEAFLAAKQVSQQEGRTFVHAFNDKAVRVVVTLIIQTQIL
jgi:hypothetical protein